MFADEHESIVPGTAAYHNLLTSAIHADQVSEARSLGIGWSSILAMLLKWGPIASKILQDLIDSIKRHSQPTPPVSPA